MGLCSSRPWILQHLAMHMSRCCSFSIFACALHMTPLAAQVSSTGRSLAVHYRPRVTNASCTSPIQKVGISATVSSGGYITFVDYCIKTNNIKETRMNSVRALLALEGGSASVSASVSVSVSASASASVFTSLPVSVSVCLSLSVSVSVDSVYAWVLVLFRYFCYIV